MKNLKRYALTGLVILIAVVAVMLKYRAYIANPWTRDGQVRAQVIQIATRVSGPIVNLPIHDNQFVKAGDLLFEIDPRTYQASLDQARAQLDVTGNNYQALIEQVEAAKASVEIARHSITQAEATKMENDATIAKNKAELDRQEDLLPQKATSQKSVQRAKANYDVSLETKKAAIASIEQTRASLAQSRSNLAKARADLGELGDANPQIRASVAAVQQAELNLEFTQVRAPVDGYITNLNLRKGTQAVANQPALALLDVSSYWIVGYFKENTIADMGTGDRAIVTLMTYHDTPLEGRVDSLGWGISQQDGSTGFELLPTISPTFEWIRLAQRVPVRIHIDDVPDGVELRVGTTASVLVMAGSAGDAGDEQAPPAPKALQ